MPLRRICWRSSSATWRGQGQPMLHKALSQLTPFLIPEKVSMDNYCCWGGHCLKERAGKQLCVCLKREHFIVKHGGHGSPGWLLTWDPLASASCVWGYRCVLPCLAVIPHFQKQFIVPTFFCYAVLSPFYPPVRPIVYIYYYWVFTFDSLMTCSGHWKEFPFWNEEKKVTKTDHQLLRVKCYLT